MTKDDVRKAVIESVSEAAALGREASDRLTDETKPIGDINGFDSYSGVVSITGICAALDYELPYRFNPFIHKSGRRAASIREVVETVYERVQRKDRTHA